MKNKTEIREMHYDPNIDPKCLSCKFFMNAPALQIWCDKLGVREDMPTKSCNKYKKAKTIYVMKCDKCNGTGYIK